MNNYNIDKRYRQLTKNQQRSLDRLAATVPQENAFDTRVVEMKTFLDANDQLPPTGTKLRNWWKNNYSTTRHYSRLTKEQRKELDQLATRLQAL